MVQFMASTRSSSSEGSQVAGRSVVDEPGARSAVAAQLELTHRRTTPIAGHYQAAARHRQTDGGRGGASAACSSVVHPLSGPLLADADDEAPPPLDRRRGDA